MEDCDWSEYHRACMDCDDVREHYAAIDCNGVYVGYGITPGECVADAERWTDNAYQVYPMADALVDMMSEDGDLPCGVVVISGMAYPA